MDTIEHGQQLALDLANELAAYGGSLIPTLFVYTQIAEKSEIPESRSTRVPRREPYCPSTREQSRPPVR